MSDSVTITLALTVRPEAAADFFEWLPQLVAEMSASPGALDIRALRHKTEPSKLLFIERWAKESDFHAYTMWRTERGDMAKLQSALAAPPDVNVWPTAIE